MHNISEKKSNWEKSGQLVLFEKLEDARKFDIGEVNKDNVLTQEEASCRGWTAVKAYIPTDKAKKAIKSKNAVKQEEYRKNLAEKGIKQKSIQVTAESEEIIKRLSDLTVKDQLSIEQALKELTPEPEIREVVKEVPVEVKKIVVKEISRELDPLLSKVNKTLQTGGAKAWVIRKLVKFL